jgi:hypothetical protein
MPITADHLRYFKALVEGEAFPGWHVWWREHESELRDLSRTAYLQLKFHKIRAAAKVLDDAGVAYEWSRKGRRAAAFADLDPAFLRDDGTPVPELWRKLYGGAVGAFEDKDHRRGEKLIKAEIRKIRSVRDEVEQAQLLGDMEFDGEQFLEQGAREVGVAILLAVSRWGTGNCLTDHAVLSARAFLAKVGESVPLE